MTKLKQCAWTALSATKRIIPSPQLSLIKHARLAYSSLHEASFITVMDDGYDASQYGYRIFIPSTPKRTNMGGIVTSTNVIRKSSSSAQHSQSFHYHGNNRYNDYDNLRMLPNDEYSKCMQSVDPSTLDILSSPEVLAILESQCDWEKCKNDSDDPYLSDCEEMKDSWNDSPPVVSAESFTKLPAIDEKKM
jgi:hypothetical protein